MIRFVLILVAVLAAFTGAPPELGLGLAVLATAEVGSHGLGPTGTSWGRKLIEVVNYLTASLRDGVLQQAGLAIDATPEDFQAAAVGIWRRLGIQFSKAAETGISFTAAHVVTALKWGAIMVYRTDAGVTTTRVNAATQTTALAADTRAAAVALLAALAVPAGGTRIGAIIINADAGNWVANTDDMTDASDLTTAEFLDEDALAADADWIAAGGETFLPTQSSLADIISAVP